MVEEWLVLEVFGEVEETRIAKSSLYYLLYPQSSVYLEEVVMN
jgi:hypothetical protein